MTIQEAIKKVISGKNLTISEATDVFTEIMGGTATEAQIAAFIVALRMKGEAVDEITGAAAVMRDKATRILYNNSPNMVDTCGTGGDGTHTFNISTAAAFIASGAGAIVAKHGNRSVSSTCGSADVLEALGVNIGITPDKISACLQSVGISFLFAPTLHKAMKYAIGPRKEIGIRTVFNILGPLTNPAFAPYQVLGVFSADLTETMASVLKNMGTKKAYVVHGLDGLDEVSLSAPTKITEADDMGIHTFTVEPEEFGFQRVAMKTITGGTPKDNARIITEIVEGKKGAYRDIAVLNAGFAIAAAGLAETPKDGIALAIESIESGAARNKIEQLVAFTNK